MKTKQFLFIFLLFAYSISIPLHAEDTDNAIIVSQIDSQLKIFSDYTISNENWIQVQNETILSKDFLSYSNNQLEDNGVSFAWDLSNFLSFNFKLIDLQPNNRINSLFPNKISLFNNQLNSNFTNEINRKLSGYNLGISSQFGLGNNYKLDLNFNYGLLDGADMFGFNAHEINTSSFVFGIRKNNFGASLNTDIYLEDNVDLMHNSRLGIELDWYFSDKTILSFGSKQHINNNTTLNQSNSIDSLTGNIQYIKFQHNL